jgi:hypothetical protein
MLIFYRFGFAKYMSVRDSELCIRGFYKLGYEVGFARVSFDSLKDSNITDNKIGVVQLSPEGRR